MISIAEISLNQDKSSFKKSTGENTKSRLAASYGGASSFEVTSQESNAKSSISQLLIAQEFISAGFASSKVITGVMKSIGVDEAIMNEIK